MLGKALILEAKKVIEAAITEGLATRTEGLTGFSGEQYIGAMQRLAKLATDKDKVYLEIGVFQGLTLLSVANHLKGHADAFGIDNFAFFDPKNENLNLVQSRREKLALDNAHLINLDYEDALHSLEQQIQNRKVGLYFIDGPHDYRSQLVCLLFAKKHLAPGAIIVIDDANYNHVRQATVDFLVSHPDYKLLFEAYTDKHPYNMTDSEEAEARKTWWDGVNILVHDPENVLVATYPQTERSRAVFEQEHNVHAARVPEGAYMGAKIADAFSRWNLPKAVFYNLKLMGQFLGKSRKGYLSMNTRSNELPKKRFAPLREE